MRSRRATRISCRIFLWIEDRLARVPLARCRPGATPLHTLGIDLAGGGPTPGFHGRVVRHGRQPHRLIGRQLIGVLGEVG